MLGHKLRDQKKKVKLLCVDVWPSTYVHNDNSGIVIEAPFETFLANVRQADLLPWIVPIRQPSLAAAQFIRNDLACVWVDAEHDYENCKADILAWLPKVKRGGIIAGHDWDDIDFPGVSKAVKEIFPADRIRIMNRSWVVEVVS
jgi:hypothetical protein